MPYLLSLTSISPIIAETQQHTLADQAVMQKVTHFISNGWLAKPESVPQRYNHTFQSEISSSWMTESFWKAWELWFHKPCTKMLGSWDRCYKGKSKRNCVLAFLMLDIDSIIVSWSLVTVIKPHQQKELLVIQPVTDLPWSLVSTDSFDWNGLQ